MWNLFIVILVIHNDNIQFVVFRKQHKLTQQQSKNLMNALTKKRIWKRESRNNMEFEIIWIVHKNEIYWDLYQALHSCPRL